MIVIEKNGSYLLIGDTILHPINDILFQMTDTKVSIHSIENGVRVYGDALLFTDIVKGNGLTVTDKTDFLAYVNEFEIGTVNEKLVVVTELSDLPLPVANVIDLGTEGKEYKFYDIIDVGGDEVKFGNNAICGTSQELAGLQNAAITINQTCTVSSFKIDSSTMIINAVGGAFDWNLVNFFNCTNIDIQNAANVIWSTIGFINTFNVQITGTLDSLVLAPNCIFRSVTTEICDFFAVRSTAVINRRIRIQDSAFVTSFATQNPIIVEVGSTIGIESFIMKVVTFIGLGSITGINGGDDIASFSNVTGDGAINSTSIANMYIKENTLTDTPTPVQGQRYKILGTTQITAILQRFTHDAPNNTIEYTSSVSRIFRVQMPYTVFAGNNNVIGIYIGVTRNGDTEDPELDFIGESEMYTTTNGARPISGAAQALVTLNQGDKVYAICENNNGNTVRVEFMNMIIETANV